MNNTRTKVLILSSFVFLTVFISSDVAKSQTQSANFPGPAIREGNRAMDDYDRTINRMKNDARAASERRRVTKSFLQ